MSERDSTIHHGTVPVLSLGTLALLDASAQAGKVGSLSHLGSDTVIITLLSSTILLLAGVLIRLRQMRVKLERKSLALEKSEHHIRLMGDNLPNVTIFQLACTAEDSFRFTYMSKGYERALGFERDEVLKDARSAYDHVYEEDIPRLMEAFRKGRENLEPTDFELRVLDVSGNLKWLCVSAVPHLE